MFSTTILYLTLCVTAATVVTMNQLPSKMRARVIGALVEGNSVRATVRMTGIAKNTIAKLVTELGPACAAYMDQTLRNLPCTPAMEAGVSDHVWSVEKLIGLVNERPVSRAS